MKKAFDQTVRDLKRGVNKKVLKVPGIEQKVLDATSNEPWGPHGSHLADIAQATRNYHEYQMIMAVIWKRINDTGKNWRHVYKALTVLEYLVAHGSERVIDDIREHAYQISTLSDFQYIDSSGRDQGSNVRRKSQSLVALVNDKERILEVRNKAIANREKFRSSSAAGGMYRPNSYSSSGGYGDRYDDGRYGNRDDDRNGYGRDKEWDGDRYGRDSDERYGRDDYKDDDYRGRSQNIDDYQYGSRSRSSDRYKDRAFDDDDRYSSRSGGARVEDHSQDERRHERKFSEQNIGAPPSYEEVVSDARSPVQDERDGEIAAPIPKASSPPERTSQGPVTVGDRTIPSPANQEFDTFDEFDPRGSAPAAPPTASGGEMDLLGSLTESFSSSCLALVPVTSVTTASEPDAPINSGSGPTFVALSSASTVLNQSFEDPFGDSPFKAIPTTNNIPAQPQNFTSMSNFQPTINQSSQPIQPVAPKMETVSNFDFGDTLPGITYAPSSVVPSVGPQVSPPELSHQNIDILADILPPSGPTAPMPSQAAFPTPTGPPAQLSNNVHGNFLPQSGFTAPEALHLRPPTVPQPSNNGLGNFFPQSGFIAPEASPAALQPQTVSPGAPVQSAFQAPTGSSAQPSNNVPGNFLPLSGYTAPVVSQAVLQAPTVPPVLQNNDALGNLLPQMGPTPQAALPVPTGLSAKAQPSKDKFETKSTVWTDTLNRGLVNLNISGPKINPLADIGIDFDSLNRKEKREKPVPTTVTSTVTMGKAMGSGSGIGRAGASALGPPTNPMIGSGMSMGGYGGGMNQPMGMNMGVGMMNMGMAQGGVPMRPPIGFPPGQTMPGGYNPMMGTGGYPPQQPYGGYR